MLQLILEGSKGLMPMKKKCAHCQKYHARGRRPDPGVLDRDVHFFLLHVSAAHHPCMAHLQAGLLGGLCAHSVMMRGHEESAVA